MNGVKFLIAAVLLAVVGGCGPGGVQKTASIDVHTARSANNFQRWKDQDVFRLQDLHLDVAPLLDGEEAFAVWMHVIAAATRSINIKTFIFRSDPVGRAVEIALLEAADRGVRVRVLVDDFFHRWEGGDFSRLDSHPNISVRLFNPHSQALPAPLGFVAEFPRVNRRMHNKMLIADDRTAIIGGRNIADEYFLKDPETYFTDFDLWIKGRDVRRFAGIFEAFWADRMSVPVRRSGQDPAEGLVRISTSSIEGGVISISAPSELPSLPKFTVDATLHADPPARIREARRGSLGEVEGNYLSALASAQSEVFIVTPYLIPEEHGARLLEDLAAKGIGVTILTNSHASTNHPSVHAGYLRYRTRLLEAGVRIYEFRGGAVRNVDLAGTKHTPSVVMHTKLAVIDGTTSLIGSPNFDPRSLQQNTEILMRLENPEFARWLRTRYANFSEKYGFRLSLGPSGTEQWEYRDGGALKRRNSEPAGSVLGRAVTTFFRVLPFDQYL